MDVAQEQIVQLAVAADDATELVRSHPQGFAWNLHYAEGTGHDRTQKDGQPRHAFAANNAYFQAPVPSIMGAQKREHSAERKVDILDRLTWFVQHGLEIERNSFEMR
jgi:hypothetical protein